VHYFCKDATDGAFKMCAIGEWSFAVGERQL